MLDPEAFCLYDQQYAEQRHDYMDLPWSDRHSRPEPEEYEDPEPGWRVLNRRVAKSRPRA